MDLQTFLSILVNNKENFEKAGIENINLKLIFFCVGMSAWHIEYKDLKTLHKLNIGMKIEFNEYRNLAPDDYYEFKPGKPYVPLR